MNTLVAVVGLAGAGKSQVVTMFENAGFFKVYFGEVVMDEVKKRGLEIKEENERMVREDLRKQYGIDMAAKLSLPKIEEGLKSGPVVIESLYSWEEYLFLKEKYESNLWIISVYAPPSLRYSRLKNRPFRPLKPGEAFSRDISQIENLHQAGPIAMADITLVNEGSLDDLKTEVDAIIREMQ